MKNTLYYGDNLDVMRRYIVDESVDLIYLDPPFNSNASYNVLFQEHSGDRAAAQIKAFEDTWEWDTVAARSYEDVVERGGIVSETIQGLRKILGSSNMMAYLSMMAPRLIEMHRVLRRMGSLYLHCDPTSSHYLKLLLDAVFGKEQYRNEIAWKRTVIKGSSKSRARQFPRSHDVLLFYTKSHEWTWNRPSVRLSERYLSRFKWDDSDGRGRYRKNVLKTFSQETFDRLKKENRLVAPVKRGAMWSYKQYASESDVTTYMDDIWTDVNALNAVALERLGYPTQKPVQLLERIIRASSNTGDVVMDPFCGCGTTISAAQRLGRHWIGIDITHLAIGLIKHRLRDQFGDAISDTYEVIGEPVSLPDAERLAQDDPFQFQAWALGLVGARTAHSARKGADRGIDGNLYFHDDQRAETKRIIFSVKAGQNVSVSMVRDLVGTIYRERADMGVLITVAPPTSAMTKEAASAGFYVSPMGGKHPRIQILTIAELLAGGGVDYPTRAQRADLTFKKARRIVEETQALPFSALISQDEAGGKREPRVFDITSDMNFGKGVIEDAEDDEAPAD